ncbi:MAG: TonB-dependent receptor [Arcicella sp.]|jgi:hypothetical protein|nr:TonB-dependent receptor [Arcicella sp.]
MYSKLIFITLFLFSFTFFAQKPTQTLRGVILDNASNQPISFASISVNTLHVGTVSDSLGNFILSKIPVGHHNITVSVIGFEPLTLNEILVTSAKEVFLTILLKEKIVSLAEVIVKPKMNKEIPLNTTASVSAKMLSVEEVRRYAGGFDDPARLVSAFAGVSSNVGNNGISVRGNNPNSLQWKFEGIEIPNPNHFADNAIFGGGVLSALSSHSLGNSDFFSGAFPAEYSNALSGVFDMAMRKGNNLKHEHTIQIGLTGLDFASEGPFKKDSKSSYLFNYRYSTLALLKPLLPEGGGNGVEYQDFSFKLNFPTKKAGIFSVWGLGLKDYTGIKAKTDKKDWDNITDKQAQDISLFMGTLGVSHKFFLNDKTYIKSTLASTTNGFDFSIQNLQDNGILKPESNVKNTLTNFIFSSVINTKFNAKHTNKTGVILTNMTYSFSLNKNAQSIVDEKGNSFLATAYSNSTLSFSENLTMNVGLNFQLFTLNNNYTIEPRIGLKYQYKSNQSLSLGYGLHSRLEKLNYYFAKNKELGNMAINKNIDFTKAHHAVLGYDLNISENVHLKVETYYQHLYDIPVIKGSSFSFLNLINDWFFNQKLENTGNGRNYGIDISLDKYLTNGFYYATTVSIFNSEYRGGDNIWRNTRFNRNYVLNFLVGKEWTFGKSNQKSFGINTRFSHQGGDRYSPIDTGASNNSQTVVFDETRAFSNQLSPSFTTHLTFVYRINKLKSTRELALKILNAGRFNEFYDFQYNYKTQSVVEHREAIVIPNLSYKIEF